MIRYLRNGWKKQDKYGKVFILLFFLGLGWLYFCITIIH